MHQFVTLLYKNVILLRRATRESFVVLACCILLPILATRMVSTNSYRRADRTDAKMYYTTIPFALPNTTMHLYVYPNNSDVLGLIAGARRILKIGRMKSDVLYFDDPVQLAARLKKDIAFSDGRCQGSHVCMGIEFADAGGPEFAYYLRPDGDRIPFTNKFFLDGEVKFCVERRRCPVAYGFDTRLVHVQFALDNAIISRVTGDLQPIKLLQFWRFGIPPTAYMRSFYPVMILVLPLAFAMLPLFKYVTGKLVEEKDCSMKQLLVVEGMTVGYFFLSWFVVFSIILLVVSGIMTLIICVGGIIKLSAVAFFLLTAAYSLCIFAVSFFFSTFFKKATVASNFSTFASLMMSMAYLIVPFSRQYGFPFEYGLPIYVVYALMIFPPFTYAIAVDQIFFAEIFRQGIQGDAIVNLGQIPTIYMILALVVSFFLYAALGFFFERLLSPEYGDFLPSLKRNKVSAVHEDTVVYPEQDFEAPEAGWKPLIRIQNVWKIFTPSKNNTVVAVRGLTFDIYDGQITCLLGHNGAGKSTLIGMMTGMLRPTAGTITIADSQMREEGNIGVCIQNSAYYADLTVREHLDILARLKNIKDAKKAIADVIEEVGLTKSADARCSDLSGGQKRRMNLAMALIGDPKVIFLDEPTSGVDPLSRRAIWQILQSRKANHCIILTTHYMDEADLLADRKAIVRRGTLRCSGSSLFLKNRFGTGYHLNIEMQDEAPDTLAAAKKNILEVVRRHVPNLIIREQTHMGISITLPFEDVVSFPQLFSELDNCCYGDAASTVDQSLKIRTYGIERTTLEEVFLKLAGLTNEQEEGGDSDEMSMSSHRRERYALKINGNSIMNASSDFAINSNSISGTSSEWTSSDKLAVRELHSLLADSEKPTAAWQWLTLLRLRLHMLRNSWFRTLGVVTFGPIIVFGLACIFLSLMEYYFSDGFNTRRMEFNPALYVASAKEASSLPPFILMVNDNSSLNNATFSRAYPNLAVELNTIDNYTFDYNLGLSHQQIISQGDFSIHRIWFRDTALHSPPIGMNMLSNLILKMQNSPCSIKATNAPIGTNTPPYAANDSANDSSSGQVVIAVDQFILVMPMGLIVLYVVSGNMLHFEQACGAFNQLRCTGMTAAVYWSVQLLVDSIQYALVAGMSFPAIMLAAWLYNAELQYNQDMIMCDLAAIVVYMPVSILFLYIVILLFRNSSTALVGFLNTVLFFVLPSIANGILQMSFYSDDPDSTFLPVYYTMLIFPNLLLFSAISAVTYPSAANPSVTYTIADYFSPQYPFFWSLIASFIHVILLGILLVVLHKYLAERHAPLFKSSVTAQHRGNQIHRDDAQQSEDTRARRDSDVIAEERFVNDNVNGFSIESRESPAFMCENLTLQYKSFALSSPCKQKVTKLAVNNLTMAAVQPQIFGLLGPNGAGKTSTLKIIVGSERPDSGTVYVAGVPISTLSVDSLFDQVSVCTQDDPLWTMLTVRDHLEYYAMLRGYHGDTRSRLVATFMELLKIDMYANRKCDQLSGGTKRKVVFAVSLMKTSRVRVILCDEPTSGLDPQSKRLIWNLLTGIFRQDSSNRNCCCIFTSHSMEEVEAVCDRIGILINGQLHCLGSIQHCKDKFGGNYTIEFKLKDATGVDNLLQQLRRLIPNALVVDSDISTFVRVNFARSDVDSLGSVFKLLEEARAEEQNKIEEYSLGQCSLEQVFLDLTKKHSVKND